jgi:hypothetical protein
MTGTLIKLTFLPGLASSQSRLFPYILESRELQAGIHPFRKIKADLEKNLVGKSSYSLWSPV